MKLSQYLLVLIFLFLRSFGYGQNLGFEHPQKINFDWKFHLGDVEKGESVDFNTATWRVLDLPHDWSIEGEYLESNSDWQGGFLPTGIGWYRKSLEWQEAWRGKRIKIHFEGIYLNSDVWVNGHHLGHRPNGYLGFEYDLTEYLVEGENIVAVRVDHANSATGRWYTGSGIYRHVWLKVQDPLHIPNWGIHFNTEDCSEQHAKFNVGVKVKNEQSKEEQFKVRMELLDKAKHLAFFSDTTCTVKGEDDLEIKFMGQIKDVDLWSPESPELYQLGVSIYKNNRLVDRRLLNIGFRSLAFSPEFGFKLNGMVTKLKGVCDHHTAGAFGAAVPDDILRYRLNLLKEMGCNAIRTAHNPFSPMFYQLCDELGIMVMNEFLDGWEAEKASDDYGLYFEDWWERDARDFITRDRNHPSVIIWSIGNEVRKPTRETQRKLIDLFHQMDPSRPVTQGGHDPTRGMKGEDLPTLLDLKGFNGNGEEPFVFERHHKKYPQEVLVGTEVPHTYQTRGVYRTQTHWRVRDFPAIWEINAGVAGKFEHLKKRVFPIPDLADEEVFKEELTSKYYKNGKYYPIPNKADWSKKLYYQSSYDNATVRASTRKTWQRVRDLPYVIGQFRWGSFDYLGETNDWPSRMANFGVIDICGFPKDHFYLYKSMWSNTPMVHILPHWTHEGKEGTKIPVVVYTNCTSVELFLNGKSLGEQAYNDEQLVWMVPYEKGRLQAVAKKDGRVVAEAEQQTAGRAKQLLLEPNRNEVVANRERVVPIEVSIVDETGTFCPKSEELIKFSIKGPGRIIGTDNGDPLDLSGYKTHERKTFRGKLMVWVQLTGESGKIQLSAKSKRLDTGSVEINAL